MSLLDINHGSSLQAASKPPPVLSDQHSLFDEQSDDDDYIEEDAAKSFPDTEDFEDTFYDCENSEENDFDFAQLSGDTPLYSKSECSFDECMVLLLSLVLSHGLSKHCLSDLLTVFKLVLPKDNILKRSVHLFYKYFERFQSPSVKHFYCQNCTQSLVSKDAVCTRCGPGKGANFFFQISLVEQLKKLFLKPGFFESISYPQTRVKKKRTGL